MAARWKGDGKSLKERDKPVAAGGKTLDAARGPVGLGRLPSLAVPYRALAEAVWVKKVE